MAALLPPSPPLPLFPSTTITSSSSSSTRHLSLIPNLSRGNSAHTQSSFPPNQQQQQEKPPPPPSPTKPPSSLSNETRTRGKKASPKYYSTSKSLNRHPAFRPLREKPRRSVVRVSSPLPEGISVGDHGVSYRLDGAPFEFQYSYTETPKAKPLALREPPYLPFGPGTMPRPWTGRAPLPKGRRKLPEFDSFKPPPPGKKGVKPVQAPGPFLPGTVPRYVVSLEEILGEPLTREEVKELLKSCVRTKRQLNMGRDGLTHNMLDNIHAHWKRRRVCKIKCKGVCTVDMDNIRQQLEGKTGGKVIDSRGGVIFLFRGRNYNYKTRPRFPLMLWKPASPVYPRLVRRVPEDLTLEEVTEMRKKGRTLPPICKLAKNGVYNNLVQEVKEAFELCELVRVNCTGLNKSDIHKIGAKLKDLVPCVLISFEFEHILMWRGKDWKSSLALEDHINESKPVTDVPSPTQSVDALGASPQVLAELDQMLDSEIDSCEDVSCMESEDGIINLDNEESDDESHYCVGTAPSVSDHVKDDAFDRVDRCQNRARDCNNDEQLLVDTCFHLATSNSDIDRGECSEIGRDLPDTEKNSLASEDSSMGISFLNDNSTEISMSNLEQSSGDSEASMAPVHMQIENRTSRWMDGIISLLEQAIENGCAVTLDGSSLDADIVYERAVDLARSAPRGPVFKHTTRKPTKTRKTKPAKAEKDVKQEQDIQPASEVATVKRASRKEVTSTNDIGDSFLDVVPQGSLKVDELAKLLA